jgi:dimethylargininase
MIASPIAFTHAITRTPAPSAVHGIRSGGGPDPDFPTLLAEHAAYVAALRGAGLTVTELPPLDDFPDALFVEDVALTFPAGAVLLRPGAPSRAGEVAHIAPALRDHHTAVLAMTGPGHVDGGDVLRLVDRVLIGLSGRTNRAGAEELIGLLAQLGQRGEIAETPPGVLHFKTGCSLIDECTIFALPQMVDLPAFASFTVVPVPDGETKAANKLRINDVALIGANFPKSRAIIESLGIRTTVLPVEQIGRIDAGLSCMSLRW